MSPNMKCVARGIDTLVLNIGYTDERGQPLKQELSKSMQEEFDTWQNTAKLQGEAVPTSWVFQGGNLLMREHGARGQWRWLLVSDLLTISVSRGRLNPIIAQVRLSSAFLWSRGHVIDAIADVHLFLMQLFGKHIWLQASEVHLCADLTGWDISLSDWQEGFVSRASGDAARPLDDLCTDGPDVPRRRWKRVGSLSFGMHVSPISCTIYNKTAEIRQKSKKTWFYDLWRANGWDGEEEVWRIEFRLRREFLHEVRIEQVYDLLPRRPDLWEYCAGRVGGGEDGLPDGWLRYVTSQGDTNRSRWPVHPVWEAVQRAFADKAEEDGLGPIVRKRLREVNLQRGVAATTGYLSTLAAWHGEELAQPDTDLSIVLSWMYEASNTYLKEKAQEFQRLVRDKRILYHLDAKEHSPR